MRHPFFDLALPLVIGHRGAAGEAPENTLESFRQGLDHGAQILESDVHATADGEVVICHDAHVARTTEGSGPIAERSLEELRALDAGYHFSTGAGHPFRGRGIRIPTLREALETFPAARFNLELKAPHPGLVTGCVALVEELACADRVLLTAGDDRTMAMLREAVKTAALPVAMGASPADVLGFVRAGLEGREPPSDPMALQIPADFGGHALVTPELVKVAHAHDVQIHVWTINAPAEMHRLLDLEVDGIVTDYPQRLADVVSERGGTA